MTKLLGKLTVCLFILSMMFCVMGVSTGSDVLGNLGGVFLGFGFLFSMACGISWAANDA